LARLAGVKASHIAYIENNRRRPSLSLLRRLADALQLNRRELLLLAHPETKYLLGRDDSGSAGPRPRYDAWRGFASNHALLRRHRVTPKELRVLKQMTQLMRVPHPKYILFILNSIRQALTPDE
jgi:transcriptional regulator with XRE-family HTH domain